jgi:hypothetical protein
MSSPTQRSLQRLRKDGWLVAIVEHWNAFTKRRNDLFGFGDLLAVRKDTVILVQTTSDANVSHRVAKIKEIPAARYWLESPNRRIVIHGWGKKGERGKPKRWECREVELTSDALGPIVAMVPKRRQKAVKELELFRSKNGELQLNLLT